MAGEKHLYGVALGDYVASALSAERWMMGVRLWVDKSVPTTTGTLPSTGTFQADDASGTGSLGAWTSNWKWELAPGESVINVGDYINDQLATAFKGLITAATLSSQVRLKQVKLYPITDTGHAFEGRSAQLTFTSPPVGASSGSMLPLEVAAAVSYKTPRPGRHGHGRNFLPGLTTVATDSNGFFTSSWVTNAVSQGLTFLVALSLDPVSSLDTHVRPIVTGAPWTQYGVVTSVNVGSVPDAQRRRRRQLVETRTSLDVSY